MAIFMQEIPSTSGIEGCKNLLKPQLLECIRNYPKLKTLPAPKRRDAVRGAFKLTENVKGKCIVVLDDIRTTGSTLNEVISVLKAAGAKRIIPIVLGYHPFANSSLALTDDDQLRCATCKSKLVPRIRAKDGEPFYGCSGWSVGDNKHTTQNLGASIQAKLKRIQPKLMKIDDELNSDSIDF
jgi:hypothetical protein